MPDGVPREPRRDPAAARATLSGPSRKKNPGRKHYWAGQDSTARIEALHCNHNACPLIRLWQLAVVVTMVVGSHRGRQSQRQAEISTSNKAGQQRMQRITGRFKESKRRAKTIPSRPPRRPAPSGLEGAQVDSGLTRSSAGVPSP